MKTHGFNNWIEWEDFTIGIRYIRKQFGLIEIFLFLGWWTIIIQIGKHSKNNKWGKDGYY